MAQLPLDQGIPRFKQNEERVDLFVNGSETTDWFTSNGVMLPSLRKFFASIQSEGEGFLTEARQEADRSQEEADRAAQKAVEVIALMASVPASLSALRQSTNSYPIGNIIQTRREGFKFEVVSSDPDLTTSGGVMLRALPDSEGFVCVDQYGAVADGNRLTGTGTDNTNAFRRAFSTPYNVRFGRGTYAVRNTVQNLKENRVVKGAGAGMVNSSPIHDRLYFNAPSSILAIGNAATRRVITRRKYRASAADPNDPALSAVIENWGAGSVFKDFSIELFCDYTNAARTNLGADWDIGFFNGCRSNVGCDHVTIMGYFRAANFYWDVTDAYGIPNLLDIYGTPVPIPTLGNDDGPEYGRASGADGCWMSRCESRGKVARVILGPNRTRTGAAYYDWVTNATYPDERGQSGFSDFRSRDCALRCEHHSNYRMSNPVGYGGTLTYAGMMQEPDFAPCVQYIDSGITNSPDVAGPTAATRGIVLDDLRYVSREAFSTRLGQVKELYFGTRTWAESAGTPSELYDVAGNNIYGDRVNEQTHFYGHLATNEDTGRVVWENTVASIFTRWVYNWQFTQFTDRQGRKRGYDCGLETAVVGQNGAIKIGSKTGGYITVAPGGVGSGTVLPTASAFLYFDTASSPVLQSAGHVGTNVTILAPSTEPTNANTPDGQISFSAFPGEIRFRSRLAAGETIISWQVL